MKRELIAGLMLAIVVGGLGGFWRTLEPGFWVVDNNANYFLGNYVYNYRSVVGQGKIPMVNFHQLLGNVHLGQGQTGVLYPGVYLSGWLASRLVGSVWGVVEVSVLMHWWLSGMGMWLLLKKLKLADEMAFAGAVAWVTMPFGLSVSRSWVVVAYLAAYLPWSYWSLLRFRVDVSIRNAVIMGSIKMLLVLQGYIQWVVMAGVVELVFVYLETRKKNYKKNSTQWLLGYLGVWLGVMVLSTPILLPLWRTAQRSVARTGQVSPIEFVENSVRVGDWLKAQVGIFDDEVIFNGSTYVYHLGLLWLGVWLWLGKKSKGTTRDWSRSWRVMAWVTGLCATVLYQPAYYIPGLNWFRWPFKYMVFAEFFFIVSLIWEVGVWFRSRKRYKGVMLTAVGIMINIGVITQNRDPKLSFSPENISDYSPEIEWVEKLGREGRVFTYGVEYVREADHLPLGAFGFASLLGIDHFGGYDALLASDLWKVVRGVPAFGSTQSKFSKGEVDYLRGWGVKYWVSDDKIAAENLVKDNEDMKMIESEKLVVVEDEMARPMVYMIGEETSAVEYQFGINEITAKPSGEGEVVFNVFKWPEYKAWLDGKPVAVYEKDARPVVKVPKGGGEVRLVFVDREFNLGLGLAGAGLMGLGAYYGVNRLRRARVAG